MRSKRLLRNRNLKDSGESHDIDSIPKGSEVTLEFQRQNLPIFTHLNLFPAVLSIYRRRRATNVCRAQTSMLCLSYPTTDIYQHTYQVQHTFHQYIQVFLGTLKRA